MAERSKALDWKSSVSPKGIPRVRIPPPPLYQMFILAAKITIFLNDRPKNLKEKRSIISSLKQKLFNKFKVSIAEIENNDKLHITTLGIAIVSNNKNILNQTINKIEDFLTSIGNICILETIVDYYSQ